MSAPKYQNLAGLIRKYYIRSEDGRRAGGIYLWELRQAAERRLRRRVARAGGEALWRQARRSPGSTLQSSSTISPAAPSRKQHACSTTTTPPEPHLLGRGRGGSRGRHGPQPPRAPRGRSCGSTWISRSSTTPTTRSSMRPTASRSANAASSTASGRARRSARRSALAYGPTEIEQLDLYRTKRPNAPVNIFVHGGAWRANRAADYALLAEPFVSAGAHFVILDFINVDEAGGSLFPMVEQVRRAVAWVYRNAKSFGGDPDRLYLTSHSSGSHLGGCVVTHDWRKDDLRGRHPQGRDVGQRHVRSQAGAAVEALEIRQVHRRDGAGAERAASPRPAAHAAHPRPRHLRDAGIPAPDPRFPRRREGGGKAGRAPGRRRATTTSRCWRRWPIPTACSAARCWRRCG